MKVYPFPLTYAISYIALLMLVSSSVDNDQQSDMAFWYGCKRTTMSLGKGIKHAFLALTFAG